MKWNIVRDGAGDLNIFLHRRFVEFKPMHAIVLSVVGSICVFHGSSPVEIFGYVILSAMILVAFMRPEYGLLAVFPVLYILPSAPSHIGGPEITYAMILGVTCVRIMLDERSQLADLLSTPKGALLWGSLGWIIVNFVAARLYEVPISDWFRGVAPFLFLIPAVPLYIYLRVNSHLVSWLGWSIAAASIMFSGRVIAAYLGNTLWKPNWYLYEAGSWTLIRPEELALRGTDGLFQFMTRVTLVLQQSTDVLVPIGIVWGVLGAVTGSSRWIRWLSLILAIVSTVAVTLTYTRSMLLSSLIVIIGISVVSAFRGKLEMRRVIGAGLALSIAFLFTVKVFDLEPIYLNRIFQSVNAIREISGEREFVEAADDNIMARLDEYRIAWKMFLESPLVGQGLGVKHQMRFSTGFGKVLQQDVGYIHSWLFYILMVGGFAGLTWYLLITLAPAMMAMRSSNVAFSIRAWVIATLAFMLIYGLFFAVFRLLSFNLLLAVVWALILSTKSREY